MLIRRRKVHDTVTFAFVRIIASRLRPDGRWVEFEQRIDDFVAGDEPILLTYYSILRLMSDEARARFIEPDLRPLT